MEWTVSGDLGRERWEDGVDRGGDAGAIAATEKKLGDGGHDEDGRIDSNLRQGLVQGRHLAAVDDLGFFHHLTRRDVEVGHVPSDVGVSDDGVDAWNRHSDRRCRKTCDRMNTCAGSENSEFKI